MIRRVAQPARTSRAVPTRVRGLTLLEVVLALTTLVIAATALLGGSTFAVNLAARDQRRLEATEVAHRLILQHMEDPELFKGQPKRTEINGHFYAFSLDEEVVIAADSPTTAGGGVGADAGIKKIKYRTGALAEATNEDRIKTSNRLVVRVYPDDDNVGVGQKVALAELTRYFVWIGGAIDEDDVPAELFRRFGATLDQSGLGNTPNK